MIFESKRKNKIMFKILLKKLSLTRLWNLKFDICNLIVLNFYITFAIGYQVDFIFKCNVNRSLCTNATKRARNIRNCILNRIIFLLDFVLTELRVMKSISSILIDRSDSKTLHS